MLGQFFRELNEMVIKGLFYGGGFPLVATPMVQFLEWLKYGAWPHLPAAIVMNYIGLTPSITTWVGLQDLIVFVSNLYLPFVLAVTGIGSAFLYALICRGFNDIARIHAPAKDNQSR